MAQISEGMMKGILLIVRRAIMLLDAIAIAMEKPISGRDGEEVINSFGAALIH